MELLLSSLSSTFPETYTTQGQALIQQLVRMWSERRVIVAQAGDFGAASQRLQELEGRLNNQQEDQTCVLGALKVSVVLG